MDPLDIPYSPIATAYIIQAQDDIASLTDYISNDASSTTTTEGTVLTTQTQMEDSLGHTPLKYEQALLDGLQQLSEVAQDLKLFLVWTETNIGP